MSIESLTDIPKSPDRAETVLGYVDSLNDRDRDTAIEMSEQIAMPDRPLAKFLVLIPVAAHQEAPQIANALAQYASQKSEQPFSLILGLNAPDGLEESRGVASTMYEIDAAKQRHPALDVRSTSLQLYDSPKIGQIRRDLWNVALLASLNEGAYDNPRDEVIGFNHDIDLVSLNAGYMQRVQQFFGGRQWLYDMSKMDPTVNSIRTTRMRHAISPDHSNISKAAFWADFVNYKSGGSYEASLVVPFSAYASSGGFPADATGYETANFKDLIPWGGQHVIKGANIQTSPRRYIDRLQYGMNRIWEEGTFGHSDGCRDGRTRRDLSQPEVEELLMHEGHFQKSLDYMAAVAVVYSIGTVLSRPNAHYLKTAEKSLRIAEKTAAVTMGSERLAKVVRGRRQDTALTERLVKSVVAGQGLGEYF